MLRITALMDNKLSEHRALTAEHGLSFYVEYNGRRILFDCGSGPNPMANARRLGISLAELDCVILSHSHYDHAAGYRDLTEAGLGSSLLYTGEHFFEPKYARGGIRRTDLSAGFTEQFLERYGKQRQTVAQCTQIFPGAWLLSGFPRIHSFETIPERFVRKTAEGFISDDFCDEICLALEVEGGLAVLVGCSHPGILNMITHVRSRLDKPVRAVFGGTHLVEADAARVDLTVDRLKEMGLEILGMSHCSGDAADQAICAKDTIQGCHLAVGDSIFLD